MQTVSMMRTPSSRATIAAGTSPPRVMAITAWNGPTSLSRQVNALQSRWNWSQDTGNALPARSWAMRSAPLSMSFLFACRELARHSQSRQHLLDRVHRGGELVGVARTHHKIGVRLLVLVEKGIGADDGFGMGDGDTPQGTADIAFPR